MGNRRKIGEMNPHHLFLAITIFSVAVTVASLAASHEIEEVQDMVAILGFVGAVTAVILFATRKYWRDARRLA